MAQHRSVGPLFSLAGGQTVSWSISYGTGQDVGIVTAAPNIIDDVWVLFCFRLRTRAWAQPAIPAIFIRSIFITRALRPWLII